jgi:hypothetical protein
MPRRKRYMVLAIALYMIFVVIMALGLLAACTVIDMRERAAAYLTQVFTS